MAVVRCPSNVSSVTLTTSGALVPASGLITCTALEATDLVQPYSWGPETSGVIDTVLVGGATRLKMPASITSITINGNVRVPNSAGIIASIPAADATVFCQIGKRRVGNFELVSG